MNTCIVSFTDMNYDYEKFSELFYDRMSLLGKLRLTSAIVAGEKVIINQVDLYTNQLDEWLLTFVGIANDLHSRMTIKYK